DRLAVMDNELEVQVRDAHARVAFTGRGLADVAPAAAEAEVAALDRVEEQGAVDLLGRRERERGVALELRELEVGPKSRDDRADQVGEDVLRMVELDAREVARVAADVGDEETGRLGAGDHPDLVWGESLPLDCTIRPTFGPPGGMNGLGAGQLAA